MFRQLCLVAVAFLALTEAKNHTTKSIKEAKSCKNNGSKKTKTSTFCAAVFTDAIAREAEAGGFLSITQGALFDCDESVSTCLLG
jgi:hypothetical protein